LSALLSLRVSLLAVALWVQFGILLSSTWNPSLKQPRLPAECSPNLSPILSSAKIRVDPKVALIHSLRVCLLSSGQHHQFDFFPAHTHTHPLERPLPCFAIPLCTVQLGFQVCTFSLTLGYGIFLCDDSSVLLRFSSERETRDESPHLSGPQCETTKLGELGEPRGSWFSLQGLGPPSESQLTLTKLALMKNHYFGFQFLSPNRPEKLRGPCPDKMKLSLLVCQEN
jgi:hypothetical protein